jgi:hypothetical protein
MTQVGQPSVCNAVTVAGGMLGKKPGKHAKKAQRRRLTLVIKALTLVIEAAAQNQAETARAAAR